MELKSLLTRARKVFILVRIAHFVFRTGMERVLNDGAGDLLPPSPPSQEIRGDWVLFHPVYSPEELKSVKVSQVTVA